jgi:SAM-dependent methyltransferase
MNFDYLELEMQPCPLCASNDFHLLKKNDRYFMGLITVGCMECGLIQTNPRPSQKGITHFYTNDYRSFYQGQKSPNLAYIQKFNKDTRLGNTSDFLSQFISFSSLKVSLLDIGCSEGELFVALRRAGYKGNLFGIEINSDFAKYAANRIDAEVVPRIEDLMTKFNVISMNHVFEHFLYPNSLINQLKSKLRKGGYLYIDVPDAEEYSRLDDLHIAHLFHYTQRTLTALFESAGFEVVLCEKYSPLAHPKSIRLVARVARNGINYKHNTKVQSENVAWQKVAQVSILNKRIKVFLALIPGVVKFYHLLKNILKKVRK